MRDLTALLVVGAFFSASVNLVLAREIRRCTCPRRNPAPADQGERK